MSLSDDLRDSVKARLSACPHCGYVSYGLREAARGIGIDPSLLGRFIRGKPIGMDTADRINEWLKKQPKVRKASA